MNKVLLSAALALSVGASSLAYAQTASGNTDETLKKPAGQTEAGSEAGTAQAIDKENGGAAQPVTEQAASPSAEEKPATEQAASPSASGEEKPMTDQAASEQPASDGTTQPTTTTTAADGTTVTTTVPNAEQPADTAATPTEQPASSETATTTEQPATSETATTTEQPATGTQPMTTAKFEKPAMAIENFQDVAATDISSDELVGTTVYDTEENNIGEVGDLVLAADGASIEQIVLDVGGFLGMGEHHVAVAPDALQILRDEGGNMRIYIAATEDQLKAEPAYVKPEAAAPAATEETAPATQPTE